MSSSHRLADNSTHGGFPSGCIESSVEMPADGLNGECIIHYEGDHNKYELMVPLVNGKREGEAIILHGVPTGKCEYRNGVLIGDVEELDEWERLLLIVSKRINSSVIINSADDLFWYDIESESSHGLVRSDKRHYAIDWLGNTNRVVMADLDSKEMIDYVNGERIDLSYAKEVVDLNTSGRRWEGGVKDGKPYGYGVIYDEEGRKEYEGFMMNEMKTGSGIEYYSDIGKVKYEGCYYYDDRFGKGVIYDRNGSMDYQGLWKNDKPCSISFDGQTIGNHTKSIEIPNDSFNDVTSFVLPSFIRSLKRIVIGDDCFGSVRLFELNGLNELESVVIGQRSFTIAKWGDDNWDIERFDGSCCFVNCPKLNSIQIGNESFGDYHSFKLTNLPSLQSIGIGGCCFYYTPLFSLTDLPQLQSVNLGDNAFAVVHSVVFENLPSLQSIQLDRFTLNGDDRDDRWTISKAPYNYKNTLTMQNLPSLTTFKGDYRNFHAIGSVILENITQLSPSSIHFVTSIYGDSFQYTYSIHSSSMLFPISSPFDATALESYIRSSSKFI